MIRRCIELSYQVVRKDDEEVGSLSCHVDILNDAEVEMTTPLNVPVCALRVRLCSSSYTELRSLAVALLLGGLNTERGKHR